MIIKFGALKYLIREIYKEEEKDGKLSDRMNASLQIDQDTTIRDLSNKKINSSLWMTNDEKRIIRKVSKFFTKCTSANSINDICRICQSNETTPKNPLISPCKCTGSIQCIHIKCLKKWYKSKVVEKIVRNTCSYYIKGLECELCKQKYSTSVEHNGDIINLFKLYRPKNAPYIIIESVNEKEVFSTYLSTMESDKRINIVRFKII